MAKQLIKENQGSEEDEQTMPTNPIEIQDSLQKISHQLSHKTADGLKRNKVSDKNNSQPPETLIDDVSIFNHYLKQEWQKMSLSKRHLSVIVYQVVLSNERLQSMMPQIIQPIINGLAQNLKRTNDFVGLYNNEQWVAVLPHTDSEGAACIADRLKKWLRTCKDQVIEFNEISVLLGVATAIPQDDTSCHLLIRKAQSSLSEIK